MKRARLLNRPSGCGSKLPSTAGTNRLRNDPPSPHWHRSADVPGCAARCTPSPGGRSAIVTVRAALSLPGSERWRAAQRRAANRLVLPVVLAGTFMAILDVAIVNVAIPSIRKDLHASFGGVEFVISAYTLTYACLLVTGGRLGDLFGRRRMFIIGLLAFSGSSALCGAAPSLAVLIGARALQGIGGALMYPQVLAIIQVTYQGHERAQALGVFGSVVGIAAIAGQLVGGSLLALNVFGLTWRPVFLVNVPLGLIAAAAALIVLPRTNPRGRVASTVAASSCSRSHCRCSPCRCSKAATAVGRCGC